MWLTKSSRDPYGKMKGRQEDREAAACFSHAYTRVTLPELRKKSFNDSDRAVPIEYFKWRRVIIDECHAPADTRSRDPPRSPSVRTSLSLQEPLCIGAEDDSGVGAVSSKRSSCAVRELLGLAIADVNARPLTAQRGTFGLTGTPLLSSPARITELASLCAGTYVTGASNHWRTVERASGRDIFLRFHDAVPSRLNQAEGVRSAQSFVAVAARRNVVDEEIESETHNFKFKMKSNSCYAKLCEKEGCNLQPPPKNAKWGELVGLAAMAEERKAGLAACIAEIHKKEPAAKVLVFAPTKGFAQAAQAVSALKMKTEAINYSKDDQEAYSRLVVEFDEAPSADYQSKCRVLLLDYEDGAGLNLQTGCHHVVLYAPLAGTPNDNESIVAAVGKEQQSIGRVRRSGQKHKVGVHRLELIGPNEERTLDGQVRALPPNQNHGGDSPAAHVFPDPELVHFCAAARAQRARHVRQGRDEHGGAVVCMRGRTTTVHDLPRLPNAKISVKWAAHVQVVGCEAGGARERIKNPRLSCMPTRHRNNEVSFLFIIFAERFAERDFRDGQS